MSLEKPISKAHTAIDASYPPLRIFPISCLASHVQDEDDYDAFSRFDGVVSTVLSDEDNEEVFDLQIGTEWSFQPQPKSLLYKKGWDLDGLSPFVHMPSVCSNASEPDNSILYSNKQFETMEEANCFHELRTVRRWLSDSPSHGYTIL